MASTISQLAKQVGMRGLRQQRSLLKPNYQLQRSFATAHESAEESGGFKKILFITLFCVVPIAIIATNSSQTYGKMSGKPHIHLKKD